MEQWWWWGADGEERERWELEMVCEKGAVAHVGGVSSERVQKCLHVRKGVAFFFCQCQARHNERSVTLFNFKSMVVNSEILNLKSSREILHRDYR